MIEPTIRCHTRWVVIYAALVILVATGCGIQRGDPAPTQREPVSVLTPTSVNSSSQVEQLLESDPDSASPTSPPIATPTPTPRPPTATPTPRPSPTLTPSPTPTPAPALRRLTTGGCCTQPFWSPDSRQVLFIDQPAPDAPLGIWGVDTTRPEATPELFTERIAFYTADMAFLVEPIQGTTVIERLADPEAEIESARWTVPNGGRSVSISPGRTRIAWQVSDDNLPFERRTTQLWVANLDLDGSDAELVATLPRGGLSGWVSDDVLLLSGRESLESRETVVYTLSLVDGTSVELARAERPRGTLLSPNGRWLAYYVTLSDEPAENGLWLVRTDGSERRELGKERFGAYQWRDARRLLIIPFDPQATFHELWELDAETGEIRRLTDPNVTPFKISNGDWRASPDGRQVAFVESQDRNIWVLTLPE